MPLVSVVIPVYNGESTLQATLDSVLTQTLTNFELIVVNDGSTDGTADLLATVQDDRLHVHHYPNKGLAASRNRGMRLATGTYISFLDADDLWTSDKLARQVAALEQLPTAAVAYSWTDYIDADGEFLQSGTHVSATGQVFSELLTLNFIESGSNVLIRREALEQVGGFDETLTAAEDWDMWLRLAQQYEFVPVPAAQVLYRRVNSMSSNVIRQERECRKVLDRAFAAAPAALQPLRRKSLARLYKYLTFKALEGPKGPAQGWQTARCLTRAIRYDPTLLAQSRVILSVLLKISKTVVSPVG